MDLGGPAGADAAQTALDRHGLTFRRTADDSIEVTITEQCPITTVLKVLLDDGCEFQGLESGSTFEDAYYAAVTDAPPGQ
jgi:hypothetical protein